jgi:hypothetical protein
VPEENDRERGVTSDHAALIGLAKLAVSPAEKWSLLDCIVISKLILIKAWVRIQTFYGFDPG